MKKKILFILLLSCVLQLKAQIIVGGTYAGCEETVPNYWSTYYSWTQSHYLQSEINYSGEIHGLTYFLCDANKRQHTVHQDNWRVWLVHYSGAYPTTFIDESTATLVFDGVFSGSGDEIWIPFTTPFTYNGTDNLAIIVANNNGGEVNYPNIPGVKTDGIIPGSSIQTNHSSSTYGPFRTFPAAGMVTNQRPIIRLETCGFINIPDANFKNELVSNTSINTDRDAEISCAEATAYKGIINIHNKSISNLTGIEAFTNITALYCNNNSLSSLDLSANTALTVLSCVNNSLTNLDISANTALAYLSCNSNLLTNLDVSNNTALTRLNCANNSITSLDVSVNTALNELECQNNSLISLSVSNNTLLTLLDFNNNSISNIDVSTNTNLVTLNCYGNSLTNLDFSNNPNLEVLFCDNNALTSINISASTALRDLVFGNNLLTNLDISNNTNLVSLACQNNSLTSLDVSNNTALTTIQCQNNSLTSLDVSANSSLNYFECQNNSLTYLNVANGYNKALYSYDFNAIGNPNLTCIQVDDVTYSTANWTSSVDSGASFSSYCSSLSTDNFTLDNFRVVPNPVENTINISLTIEQDFKRVQVFTLLGKKILEANKITINVSVIPSGIYLLKIENKNGEFAMRKILKK